MKHQTFNIYDDQRGWLVVAGAEVWMDFTPASAQSQAIVEKLVISLGLGMKNIKKKARCLSDLIMAAKTSSNGLVAWSMNANRYTGGAYGYSIARKVKKALEEQGLLELVQKASKKNELCAIFRPHFTSELLDCRFKGHGIAPPIVVRSGRCRDEYGKTYGGRSLSLRKFGDAIQPVRQEVLAIRQCMLRHPLQDDDGREYVRCWRIFNQGSLTKGGRFYGPWQQRSEASRLKMTMGGHNVAEIDMKAAFLHLVAARRNVAPLPFDPYGEVGFVKAAQGTAEFDKKRSLCKFLLSSYLSNGGKTNRFPKGEKERGEDGKQRTVSVREKFGLPKKAKATDYYGDIERAFPFIKECGQDVFDLMYLESQIMKDAMLSLAAMDVPSYPVHDCLMCQAKDVSVVVEALSQSMNKHVGRVLPMDVAYFDGRTEKIGCDPEPQHQEKRIKRFYPTFDWCVDDDFSLIEA